MIDVRNFDANKYILSNFEACGDNTYKQGEDYITSLCFRQEPDMGEGSTAADISQYPLEDVLDRFCVYISDFYEELNTKESQICYLEFASTNIEDIHELQGIIGKHVYNKTVIECGEDRVVLIIE